MSKVYFMQPVGGGAIKIGCSSNVGRRRLELQVYYGCRFVLLKTEPGNTEDEKVMHARFADLRIGGTELFQPGPELTDHIGVPRYSGDFRDVQEIPRSTHAKNIRIVMRTSRAWGDWLDRIAKERGCDKSFLVRQAAKAWAEEQGCVLPPEE